MFRTTEFLKKHTRAELSLFQCYPSAKLHLPVMSFLERWVIKTCVFLGVIALITIPIIFTRSQLANVLHRRNYLFFSYLLLLCSLVSLILPLFFKNSWNVGLWPWQQGFKGLKCIKPIWIDAGLEFKGKNHWSYSGFLFVLSGSLQKQRLTCTL